MHSPVLSGWDRPLERAFLLRRYKRFLADVRLQDGTIETVHCPNSGSMLGMAAPGLPVVVSDSLDPKRRLRRTLELVQVDDGGGRAWVGVNTMRPNHWVRQALAAGLVPGVPAGLEVEREVSFVGADETGRIDIRISSPLSPPLWIEVKNTTLVCPGASALEACFPDARTERGERHLRLLVNAVERGERAMVVFLVNRGDAASFRAAEEIDPAYAAALETAVEAGVSAVALQVRHAVRRAQPGLMVASRVQGVLPAHPGLRKGYPREAMA